MCAVVADGQQLASAHGRSNSGCSNHPTLSTLVPFEDDDGASIAGRLL